MNPDIFISDAFVRALGWTLVHSLWQGGAIAFVLLILLPRLKSARSRYRTAYGALMAMFATAAVTFGWVYSPAENASANLAITSDTSSIISGFLNENQAFTDSIWNISSGWLEEHYPLIVAVWLLGFVFFILRLASGLWYVEQLRKREIFPVDAIWHQKMTSYCRQFGISRAVGLFESALVHTPTALGWLKPVVLLPVGLVNRLSPAETEAILAHELAHIARRDWIFNLLQAFIEALFYYHPSVWWMSQLIRNERENACDDDALAATGNRLAYAKALVQVQEMAKPAPLPALALGMSGSRRHLLLERIRRILNQPQQKSQIMEKFIATAILLVLLTFIGIRANQSPSLSAAFAQISDMPKAILGIQTEADQFETDTIPKPARKQKIIREDDNQRVEAEFQDGELTRLNIDGKEVPESEFAQHEKLTSDLRREMRPPAPPPPPMPPAKVWDVPPMPPAPPVSPRLSTTKDDEGNTIIRLDREGDPMEIRVKDGEVWVDGKRLEEGESLELPGIGGNPSMFWSGDGNYIYVEPGDIHVEGLEGLKGLEGLEGFKWTEEDQQRVNEDMARAREELFRSNPEAFEKARKELREQMKKQKKEYEQMRKEQDDALREEMKTMQLQQREQRKALEESRQEMRRAQQEQRIAMEDARKHQAEAMYEMRRAQEEQARTGSVSSAFKNEMQNDGLISDPGNYSFKLSGDKLIVNGKKQSADLHAKYLDLYRKITGHSLNKNDNFQISESN